MLAKMLYGECRGVASEEQQAACVWVVLNRVDSGRGEFGARPLTISGVLTKRGAFAGYSSKHPVWDSLLALARDVLERWELEKAGELDVGRAIPADYLFFSGDGRGGNRFRREWKDTEYWGWTLDSPYET